MKSPHVYSNGTAAWFQEGFDGTVAPEHRLPAWVMALLCGGRPYSWRYYPSAETAKDELVAALGRVRAQLEQITIEGYA